MSSTQEGSSAGACTSKKAERSRRMWTHKEEVVLIATMKELIAQGWKSDNAYKAGYLNHVEAALKKQFPDCGLKATPHIHSRLASWKKYYNSLNQMLARSGVGWNSKGNHMIECEDEQWEQIVEADKPARTMRYKQWPYYEDWKELFGNDRATGENAEDLYEAYAAYRFQEPGNPDDLPSGDKETSYENDVHEDAYDRVSQSARDGQQSTRGSGGKKRKIQGELQGVCELLSEMNQATNARLEHLANRIGYEFDMGKARQEVLEQLEQIACLSLEQKFVVCEIVAFKAERLDIWRGMKVEARAQYVAHLLKVRGG